MKFILSSLLLFSGMTFSSTVYVHQWDAGNGINMRTAIKLTNICSENSVTAKVKFWKYDGTILANQALDGIHTTNSNGEITVTVQPKVTHVVRATYQYLNGYGHAEITSSVMDTVGEPHSYKCLLGSYSTWSTVSNNPYDGVGVNFLINKGDLF